MDHTSEQWRPVVGWEGLYEVSDQGRVRSLDRVVTDSFQGTLRTRRFRGRIMSQVPDSRGLYLQVRLKRQGEGRTCLVHRLVLEAFVGEPPFEGAECCHGDDVKSNNHLSNLRWDTSSANKYDRVANGLHHQVNKTHCKQGHEFSPENTRLVKGTTRRVCRTCAKQWMADYKERERKKALCVSA